MVHILRALALNGRQYLLISIKILVAAFPPEGHIRPRYGTDYHFTIPKTTLTPPVNTEPP